MTALSQTRLLSAVRSRLHLSSKTRKSLDVGSYNVFVWFLLILYLLPVAFMIVTGCKSTDQLSDASAPWYPASLVTYTYQGKTYGLYDVPMADGGTRRLALVSRGRMVVEFLDPQNPAAGPFKWQGDQETMRGVYEFDPVWSNFTILFRTLPFAAMLKNTLLITLIGEIGVLASSIVVAYGFSRFPLPGGSLLFYLLIATILIPDKVITIPTYLFYVKSLHWAGTIYPLVLHLFFGSAVYIFLLRQNFRSLPIELEESAMLDGAGPLRRLFSVVLPQSWPVVITICLLHFFYTWNETRQAALYLTVSGGFMPLSFAVQTYQSLVPIQNVIEASSLVVLVIPVIVLFLAQRYFVRGLVITGMEKH
jgi:multiple sugar transport system permease protein